MKKLDFRSYLTMPWKNGGGTTTEIACSPDGGSLEDFDWRVSMARVAAPGPFSRFAGVDRSIAILDGEGITLLMEGRGATRLDRTSAPFAFPGDIDVAATLLGGPIDDLNVMTRRGRARHLLTRSQFDAAVTIAALGERMVLVVVDGSAEASAGGTRETLVARDALVVARGTEILVSPRPAVEIAVVDLWSVRPSE